MRPRLWSVCLLIVLVASCANERAITGGPEDKDAPEVVSASPSNASTQVDPRTEIRIRFNEQMKRTSLPAALKIWPRPPGGYELKTGWTWLRVSFPEALDSNETYLLTLDKSAQDLQGNGLSKTYVLAFSTGEKLNSGRVKGRIFGTQDIRQNGQLFLFRSFDTGLDELRKQDPDYVFQADDEGYFDLSYLQTKSYMLFHHWDRNSNKQIDGGDYFGRPTVAAVQARSDSLLTSYDIWPRLIRPDKVKLIKATDRGHGLIQVRVDRPVTREGISDLEIYSSGVKVPILGRTNLKDDNFAIVLQTAAVWKDQQSLYLRNFVDTSGYRLKSDTIAFSTPKSIDTLGWAGLDVTWSNGKQTLFPNDTNLINIYTQIPVVFSSDSAFTLVDEKRDSVIIRGQLQKANSMHWQFAPDSNMVPATKYAWTLASRFVQTSQNTLVLDSLYQGKLETVHPDSLGSLTVSQMSSRSLHCELAGKNVLHQFVLRPGESLTLENLPANTYSLTGYLDENGDESYNSGGLGPAGAAEPFYIFPDEIRIRARWETDLGVWNLRSGKP